MINEAPEKIVRWIGVDNSINYGPPVMEYARGVPVTYIREDLIQKRDHLPDAEKMVEQQRRREMFRLVISSYLTEDKALPDDFLVGVGYKRAAKETELLLAAEDKFVKGSKGVIKKEL